MTDKSPQGKSLAGRYPLATVILINIAAMFVLAAWPALAMFQVPKVFYTTLFPWQALANLLLAFFAAHNKQLKLMLAHAFFFFFPLFVFVGSLQH